MLGFDLARVMAGPDGRKMFETIKRLVRSQGETTDSLIKEFNSHLERMERLSESTGKPVKQVADEALDLFERAQRDAKLPAPLRRQSGS